MKATISPDRAGKNLLLSLARHFPDELDRTLAQRELLEPADGGYLFQVELTLPSDPI